MMGMKFISNDQANQVADELVAQANSQKVNEKNSKARPVPFIYRFPELAIFEPWERVSILSEARTQNQRNLRLILLKVILGLAVIAAALYVRENAPFGKLEPLALWLGVPAILFLSPGYIYDYLLIRRFVRARAIEQKNRLEHIDASN